MKIKLLLALGAAALAASAASASVSVGGYTFDNNAFVDALTASSGSYTTSGGSLASVLTDVNAASYAFSFSPGAYVDLSFTDNVAVNGAGKDIVLFELGVPDGWNVTIGGITNSYTSAGTGFTAGGFGLNAAAFDLSDFGIAAGSSISSLRLSFFTAGGGTIASTSLIGALNSGPAGGVPEASTWAMLIAGFGLTGAAMRRRTAVTA